MFRFFEFVDNANNLVDVRISLGRLTGALSTLGAYSNTGPANPKNI
jgi:hypothetical protein